MSYFLDYTQIAKFPNHFHQSPNDHRFGFDFNDHAEGQDGS